jgi:hypothetical protein
MKIVNINDIEDLILAKHEIDLYKIEINELTERSNLNDFINTYATPKYIYIINDKQLPFSFVEINNIKYLFITEYTDLNQCIINKLKHLNYDLNNLTKLSNYELSNMIDMSNTIIYNGQFYN